MVTRPVFSPIYDHVGVKETASAPFVWNPGFSMLQKQKNVVALHEAIKRQYPELRPLEISSRSRESIGVNLSAFKLGVWSHEKYYTVESVYQASKVFEGNKGPFPGLYEKKPSEVRDSLKLVSRGRIVSYQMGSDKWALMPTRAFYDWVYCRALYRNQTLVKGVRAFNCFTDIAFNPIKSVNCQAYAVSLYLSLMSNGVLEEALSCKQSFLKFHPQDVIGLVKTNNAKAHARSVLVDEQMNLGM